MKYALANIYLAIVVAYLCLFVLLMAMIKRSYKQVYEQVKCKVILLFSGLIFVMTFRWFYYLCLQFNWIGFNLEDLLNEVPFYVSELLISTAYIVFLSKVYDSSEEPVARRKSSSQEPKTITSEQYRKQARINESESSFISSAAARPLEDRPLASFPAGSHDSGIQSMHDSRRLITSVDSKGEVLSPTTKVITMHGSAEQVDSFEAKRISSIKKSLSGVGSVDGIISPEVRKLSDVRERKESGVAIAEEDNGSHDSGETIEVRSEFDAENEEEKFPHHGESRSLSSEEDLIENEFEHQRKIELSWRGDKLEPQMDPRSLDDDETPLFSMKEKVFRLSQQ